ncbi:MAG: nickel-dependent lactate racemase [Eubacteriales bacterium]|nr:nickel-dependent lactate racemase [Eubacteriales bacterium]
MKIKLGYGSGFQSADVPENNIIKLLKPNEISRKGSQEIPAASDAPSIVREALAEPIGAHKLRDMVQPGEKIVIITSDITRPMPTWDVVPHVLDELYTAGAKAGDISLVFALGSHRPHTEEEKLHLAGEQAYYEISCVDSNPMDCIHMGVTSRGTPIDITRIVAEADRRICLGNIEYHYFAGYSGGIKALMPGASTPEAIQANHSMMVDENACAGKLDGNPLREDLEEAAGICNIDFIVNVVLDEHKKIIHAVAGGVIKAHRRGCEFLDSLYKVDIPERADIVIVSQGGAPKDLNLYQTQKALDNSKHAVKDGGTIILVGACPEGLGQKTFEEWITEADKPEDLIKRVREDFKLGGHKAAAIAMVLQRANIKLVSEMDPDFVRSIFLEPYHDLQTAILDALREHGRDASIIIMPYGGSTLPVL